MTAANRSYDARLSRAEMFDRVYTPDKTAFEMAKDIGTTPASIRLMAAKRNLKLKRAPRRSEPTNDRWKVWECIARTVSETGRSPSYSEIARRAIITTKTIHTHVDALDRDGYLRREGKAWKMLIHVLQWPDGIEPRETVGRIDGVTEEYTAEEIRKESIERAEAIVLLEPRPKKRRRARARAERIEGYRKPVGINAQSKEPLKPVLRYLRRSGFRVRQESPSTFAIGASVVTVNRLVALANSERIKAGLAPFTDVDGWRSDIGNGLQDIAAAAE